MPSDEDILFGEIAVEKGLLTADKVAECAENQKAMAAMGIHQPLSEVMVAKGWLDRNGQRDIAREATKRSGRRAKIGSYEVIAKLGQGGMGAVFKAMLPATGAVVAIKVLPPELAKNKTFVQRFRNEAEVASRLDHPNVVRAISAGEDRGFHYFAMEYVEGENVGDRIKREGVIPEAESLQVVRQMAMALQHAHDAGLLHRDIKPDNIFLTVGGHAKLGDLGLAREAATDSRMTQSGVIVGTPDYLSPEQARGGIDIDIRSDIYSLGATFFHMVTGETPFPGKSPMEVLNKQINEEPPWPASINRDLSNGVCQLITRMLAKEPEDRFEDPFELIGVIDRVIRGGGVSSKTTLAGSQPRKKADTGRHAPVSSRAVRPKDTRAIRTRPSSRPSSREGSRASGRGGSRGVRSSQRMRPARRNSSPIWIAVACGAAALVATMGIIMSTPEVTEDPPRIRMRPRRPKPRPKPAPPEPASEVERPPVSIADIVDSPPEIAPRPVPAAVPPPPSLRPTGRIDLGTAEVIWQEDFDGGQVSGWSGLVETRITLDGSRGARRCRLKPDDKYFAASLDTAFYRFPGDERRFPGRKIFDAAPDVYVSFYYWLDGAGEVVVLARNERNTKNLHNNVKNAARRRWTPVVLSIMDFDWDWDRTMDTRQGDTISAVVFCAGSPGQKDVTLVIDGYAVTKGARPRIVPAD